MKTPGKIAVVLLALAAAGSSAIAYREYLELVRLRADAPDPGERARLQKAAWDAQRRANLLAAQLAAARTGAGGPAAGSDGQSRALGEYASDMIARIDDPEVRRLMAIVQKGQIVQRFAGLFRELKLSPEKLAEFENLMVERQNAATDVLIAASQQGINPLQDPQQFQQMVRDAQGEIDQKIQVALGPDDYSQFQTYQQTQNQRGTVNQLQQNLSFTDTPLSDDQKTQMTQIISQSAPAGQAGGGAINDNTIALAQGVLSAPQLDALRSIQQLQQAGAQLQSLMSQARAGAQQDSASANK
jgi:hypothetical protein